MVGYISTDGDRGTRGVLMPWSSMWYVVTSWPVCESREGVLSVGHGVPSEVILDSRPSGSSLCCRVIWIGSWYADSFESGIVWCRGLISTCGSQTFRRRLQVLLDVLRIELLQ